MQKSYDNTSFSVEVCSFPETYDLQNDVHKFMLLARMVALRLEAWRYPNCPIWRSKVDQWARLHCNPHSSLIGSPLFVFVMALSILCITYAIILLRLHFRGGYFSCFSWNGRIVIIFFNPGKLKSRRCKIWTRKCQYLSRRFSSPNGTLAQQGEEKRPLLCHWFYLIGVLAR